VELRFYTANDQPESPSALVTEQGLSLRLQIATPNAKWFALLAILFSVRAPFKNPLDPGLCGDCVHARQIQSDRGSRFLLCQLFLTDGRFEKYPRLPVAVCDGYRQATPPKANDDA
jgi:hypothetical protein